MKEKKLKITQVAVNAANPRTITEEKFDKLITSILVLPKMLEVRPVVVDSKFVALGGNMRIKALQSIAEMSADDIASRLAADKTYSAKSKAEQDALLAYWAEWLAEPYINAIVVDNFSEAEQKEFIIKDNVSFGKWDWDALANEWDAGDLNDWGMDVWFSTGTAITTETTANSSAHSPVAAEILANEQDNNDPVNFEGNLPSELQGVDLNPENLPKIQGSDETPFERIIIVYPKERKGELLGLLGMADINKVVYHLDEILGGNITSIDTDEE